MQFSLQYDNCFLFYTGDPIDQNGQTDENNSIDGGQMNDNSLNHKTQSTNSITNANNGNFDNETKHSTKIEQSNEQSAANSSSSPNSSTENIYSNEIKNLNECFNRFKQLAVDEHEFICLKAIALFRPGKNENEKNSNFF